MKGYPAQRVFPAQENVSRSMGYPAQNVLQFWRAVQPNMFLKALHGLSSPKKGCPAQENVCWPMGYPAQNLLQALRAVQPKDYPGQKKVAVQPKVSFKAIQTQPQCLLSPHGQACFFYASSIAMYPFRYKWNIILNFWQTFSGTL